MQFKTVSTRRLKKKEKKPIELTSLQPRQKFCGSDSDDLLEINLDEVIANKIIPKKKKKKFDKNFEL